MKFARGFKCIVTGYNCLSRAVLLIAPYSSLKARYVTFYKFEYLCRVIQDIVSTEKMALHSDRPIDSNCHFIHMCIHTDSGKHDLYSTCLNETITDN